jgi:hypothetical protein
MGVVAPTSIARLDNFSNACFTSLFVNFWLNLNRSPPFIISVGKKKGFDPSILFNQMGFYVQKLMQPRLLSSSSCNAHDFNIHILGQAQSPDTKRN